jgi:hypothetical protein
MTSSTMTLHRLLLTLALVPAAGACGVKSVGDLDDTDGGSGGGSTESAGSSDDSASASGNTSSATTDKPGTESSSASDSSAGDDGTCPPFDGSSCSPQEQFGAEAVTWSFDGGTFTDADLIDVQCTIADFVDDATTMTITLECAEEELAQHTIVAPHNPVTPLNLVDGITVRLTHHIDMPFWTNEWFTLRGADGQFLLGGVQSSELLPADAPDLFAPVALTLQDDFCVFEVDCDEFCGPVRRNAIAVAVDGGEPVSVPDGNSGVVGALTNYTVVVGEALSRSEDSGCKDVPEGWFAILVYDSSEG